jgi:GT2 family glycosyltransferase
VSGTGGAVRLSVIIVTWNVRELAIACIESVHRAACDIPLEIIVVDNASDDGTVAGLRARFPDVIVIANEENVGFPIANNQGLRHARGEYLLYLNPDTEVGPGSIQACMRALDADPAIGVAGCRLVLEDGSVQLECARRPYLLRHLAMELLYLHMLFPRSRIFGDHLMGYWDHFGERDVEAICGAFMLARREAVEQVGGLPDEVFMYHEDLAFCLRVRRAGWRIRYLGDHATLHRWRASSSRSDAKLALLEGQYKLQLIRDAQGAAFAAAGRVLFGVRCAVRAVTGLVGSALFGRTRAGRRYARALDWRTHALQLAWTVAPGAVAHLVPAPPARPRSEASAPALQGTASAGGACPPQ